MFYNEKGEIYWLQRAVEVETCWQRWRGVHHVDDLSIKGGGGVKSKRVELHVNHDSAGFVGDSNRRFAIGTRLTGTLAHVVDEVAHFALYLVWCGCWHDITLCLCVKPQYNIELLQNKVNNRTGSKKNKKSRITGLGVDFDLIEIGKQKQPVVNGKPCFL